MLVMTLQANRGRLYLNLVVVPRVPDGQHLERSWKPKKIILDVFKYFMPHCSQPEPISLESCSTTPYPLTL
jgi:hypothetical protein